MKYLLIICLVFMSCSIFQHKSICTNNPYERKIIYASVKIDDGILGTYYVGLIQTDKGIIDFRIPKDITYLRIGNPRLIGLCRTGTFKNRHRNSYDEYYLYYPEKLIIEFIKN